MAQVVKDKVLNVLLLTDELDFPTSVVDPFAILPPSLEYGSLDVGSLMSQFTTQRRCKRDIALRFGLRKVLGRKMRFFFDVNPIPFQAQDFLQPHPHMVAS